MFRHGKEAKILRRLVNISKTLFHKWYNDNILTYRYVGGYMVRITLHFRVVQHWSVRMVVDHAIRNTCGNKIGETSAKWNTIYGPTLITRTPKNVSGIYTWSTHIKCNMRDNTSLLLNIHNILRDETWNIFRIISDCLLFGYLHICM